MRIIKKGNPNPITFHCKACGCVFEANVREYSVFDCSPDFDIDPEKPKTLLKLEDFYYRCNCPCCGKIASVNVLEAKKERDKSRC